ncbi:hypothetical protein AcW1_002551 [Taiwanofungus camphoratus]|uniref:Cytochrome P450 monooxygenase n=1 Tax=Taiwanofungus camphoratus TaxID=2696576 RepID=H9LDW2_TAICA|nr:cytochrome P450 monooxygenase [Antrodia cinnamomea]KAI0922932.1 hypothetical protein AcV5_009794 [Antrodia cinnamomea]KAI0943378.1 hypothetical protein AcW1_002551 [Antrodia cinnamomea]
MSSFNAALFSRKDIGKYVSEQVTGLDGVTILVLGFFVAYYLGLGYLRQSTNLPPGPKPLPLIGNMLQVPTEGSWLYFHSLCKKYGPVVRLTLGRDEMLVLDELEDINEILVKRSRNYSSRRSLVYAGKYRSVDRRLGLLPYGTLLKKQRGAILQMMNAEDLGSCEHIQTRGTMKLLSDILETPTNAYMSIKWYTAETLLTLVYGKKLGEDGNDLRKLLHIIETFIRDVHPRSHIVDMLPVLDRMPDALAPWRSEAQRKHEYEITFYTGLLKEVKKRVDEGENTECFAARLWEMANKIDLDEVSMAYVAAAIVEAGTDNTAGTILWFLVAMMHYPAVMKKAQAELDKVLGPEGHTPPEFQHLEQLTYCVALVKEVIRWMPTAPISMPHRSLEEDIYKGYRIAAGTTIVPNIWAVHHNESLYPDPFKFEPERFMPADGGILNLKSLNEGHSGFGFGRRICPGQYLAAKTVWIGVVRLLWAFDITPPVDASGAPILPDPAACRPGITAEPDTFKVVMTPRSEVHVQSIKRAAE